MLLSRLCCSRSQPVVTLRYIAKFFGRFHCSAGRRYQRRSTIPLRHSPRCGSPPVSRALKNSNAATALLAGPSHNSAVSGVMRSTHTFGSSGPFHHMSSVGFQISAALAWSRRTSQRAVIEFGICIDECEPDIVVGFDLVFL